MNKATRGAFLRNQSMVGEHTLHHHARCSLLLTKQTWYFSPSVHLQAWGNVCFSYRFSYSLWTYQGVDYVCFLLTPHDINASMLLKVMKLEPEG